MASQTVTLTVPETVLQRLTRTAQRAHRSVDAIMVEMITAAVTSEGVSIQALREALGQMAYLNDAALWQAARATVLPPQRELLENLHQKQQRTSLTVDEDVEREALERLYGDTLLVRAQAAVLLMQRGYDVSDLDAFAPLE